MTLTARQGRASLAGPALVTYILEYITISLQSLDKRSNDFKMHAAASQCVSTTLSYQPVMPANLAVICTLIKEATVDGLEVRLMCELSVIASVLDKLTTF